MKKSKTSWEKVSNWYDKTVSSEGHLYHREVIFPKILPYFKEKNIKVLDLGCGQGPLARQLPKEARYLGIDLSPSLIKSASSQSKHTFRVDDATKPLDLDSDFTHAVMVLSLQNMEQGEGAVQNAAKALIKRGKLIIVLNHPCFRIPRQSHWGIDEPKKLQYRRVDSYLSSLKIPIQHSPSKGAKSETTLTFHHPLSTYSEWLDRQGFSILKIEEWCSHKESSGPKARMENRARKEFPLFLTFIAEKR